MSGMNRIVAFAQVALLVVGASSLACSSSPPSLTVVSFGGAYQAAQSKAYMQPFATQTGIRVVEGDYNGEYGLLSQRATASQGSWDVVSVESAPTARGTQEGIFLPMPDWVWDGQNLLPQARRSHAAGHLVFSTILAYDSSAFRVDRPASWIDFWDVERFPGKRALRNNPRGTLEIALLAAGVPPRDLYPLDVDRALGQLDRLRPHLVFWEAGAQPIQLLANKTVVMSSAYNGRVWNAKTQESLPLEISWNQGLMETEFWAVPKNAPNPEEAFRFIAFALQQNPQAVFANEIAYGPTNLGAIGLVHSEILAALPNSPASLPLQVPVNSDWWAANEAEVSAKWQQWQNRR